MKKIVDSFQSLRDRLGGNCVFKMADLAALYKKRFKDLGGVLPERVHSKRLKLRHLAHIDGLTESKRGKTTYLAFDDDLCDVFKTMKKISMKMPSFCQELLISYVRACWKGNRKSLMVNFISIRNHCSFRKCCRRL